MPSRHSAHTAAIGVWAGSFDWLWLRGETSSFAGAQTAWGLTLLALALTAAATLHAVAGPRTAFDRRAPSSGEMLELVVLVAPVLPICLSM
jgi:hypothetical protein